MRADRAAAVLADLAAGRDPAATAAEVAEMFELALVAANDAAQRQALAASASEVPALRETVRTLRRTIDLESGPRSFRTPRFGRAPPPDPSDPRLRLQAATQDLEQRVLAAAAVDAMVLNAATGGYLSLTLAGRQRSADLSTFLPRVPQDDLAPFARRVDALRWLADQTVAFATELADQLFYETDDAPIPAIGGPSLRSSALLLSLPQVRTENASFIRAGVAIAFNHFPSLGTSPYDRLLGATLLSLRAQVTSDVRAEFSTVRAELEKTPNVTGARRSEIELLAAAIVAGDPVDTRLLAARAEALAPLVRPAGPLAAAPLVLANLPVEVTARRYQSGVQALAALGYPYGSATAVGAATLAASPWTEAEFAPRLAAIDPAVRALFPSAPEADAILAALPATPAEVLRIHEYCVGAISRRSYFEETLEIDYLALLLAAGLTTPDTLRWAFAGGEAPTAGPAAPAALDAATGATGPVGGPPRASPPLPTGAPVALGAVAAAGAGLALGAVFLTQGFWLFSSYLDYARQHPLHSNAVPIYG